MLLNQIQIENSDVLKALQEYYTLFQEDIKSCGFFFVNKLHNRLLEQSVREIICKYTAMTEYDIHITPHMFRHSFATFQIYIYVAMSKQKEILSLKHPRNKIKVKAEQYTMYLCLRTLVQNQNFKCL